MKKTEVKVSFDSDKMSAVKQYMEKKDADIQAELTETIAKLYEKYVPAAVREFIEFNAQNEPDSQPKPRKPASASTPAETPISRSTTSSVTGTNE